MYACPRRRRTTITISLRPDGDGAVVEVLGVVHVEIVDALLAVDDVHSMGGCDGFDGTDFNIDRFGRSFGGVFACFRVITDARGEDKKSENE